MAGRRRPRRQGTRRPRHGQMKSWPQGTRSAAHASSFVLRVNTARGLTSYCRDCRAQRARDRRANAGEGFARQAVSLAGRNHDGPTKLPWSLRPWRFWRPTGRVTRRCGVTGSGSTTGPVWPVTCPGSEGRNDASRTTTRDRAGRSRQGSCRGETRPDAGRPGCRPSSWLARKKPQPCASATGRLCLPGRPGRYSQLRALAGTR